MLRSICPAVAAGMLVASCGTTPYGPAGARGVQTVPLARSSQQAFVTLHVHNRNAADIRVYVIRGGTWVKVGTVGSFAARSFPLSAAETGTLGALTLAVETLGSRQRHVAELFDFEPGQEIEWQIEGRLELSRLQPRVYRPQ